MPSSPSWMASTFGSVPSRVSRWRVRSDFTAASTRRLRTAAIPTSERVADAGKRCCLPEARAMQSPVMTLSLPQWRTDCQLSAPPETTPSVLAVEDVVHRRGCAALRRSGSVDRQRTRPGRGVAADVHPEHDGCRWGRVGPGPLTTRWCGRPVSGPGCRLNPIPGRSIRGCEPAEWSGTLLCCRVSVTRGSRCPSIPGSGMYPLTVCVSVASPSPAVASAAAVTWTRGRSRPDADDSSPWRYVALGRGGAGGRLS